VPMVGSDMERNHAKVAGATAVLAPDGRRHSRDVECL